MKLVYVAGPYRARTTFGIQANIRAAAEVALKYWKQGYAVICPHANTAYFDGEADDEVWLNGDLEMLSRCDLVVMLPTWRRSAGAIAEHERAKELGIAVVYEDDDAPFHVDDAVFV